MRVVRDSDGMRDVQGGVLVPTMGALHAGHAALIERAKAIGSPVVVSLFVNPTQFGSREDYGQYPRPFEADCAECERLGVDVLFAPSVETMYPAGVEEAKNDRTMPVPEIATAPHLEDQFRPGHFAGVCQVVRRLFAMVKPKRGVFGEKDYQQLQVIRAMVLDEGLGIEIVGRPTVRDPDGLSLSSRNRFLSDLQRKRALGLSKALAEAQTATTQRGAQAAMRSVLLAHQVEVDYAVIRDARTLLPVDDGVPVPRRALVAGKVGTVRLIDNTEWRPGAGGGA